MALNSFPPTYSESVASLREGSSGWPVYAVQTGLNDGAGASLSEDGNFGPMTTTAVKAFQKRYELTADGVVGPITKRFIVEACARRLDRTIPSLPDGLVRVLSRAEGGDNISAINQYDPPGGPTGCDCGVMQIRCYEPYTLTALKQAFSPYDAMKEMARRFEASVAQFMSSGWTRNNLIRSQRCALLSHNWPAGARDIAADGRLYNPDGTASWVPAGVKMLDGTVVNTRQEWVDFYAMGIAPHCGHAPATIKWGT